MLGRHASEPPPDLLVCVVDATNLRLNLRLVLDLKRMGRPMLVALNMSDVAKQRGYRIDRAALEQALGVPVIETVAIRAGGERGCSWRPSSATNSARDLGRLDARPPLPPRRSRPRNARCAGSSSRSVTGYRRACNAVRGWIRWCCTRSPDRCCWPSSCS